MKRGAGVIGLLILSITVLAALPSMAAARAADTVFLNGRIWTATPALHRRSGRRPRRHDVLPRQQGVPASMTQSSR